MGEVRLTGLYKNEISGRRPVRIRPRVVWLWLILALGVFFRVDHYLENRSLWLDEAYVANQVLAQSFGQILANAPYDVNLPSPPVGFLLVEKIFVQVLGNSEYALRLFPLLCGLAAFLIFARLATRHLPLGAAYFALGLFACCESLIYYAAEVKPYSGDVLLGLVLTDAVLRARRQGFSPPSRRGLLVWGACCLFFSHAAFFVLAAGALVMLGWAAPQPGRRSPVVRVLVCWGLMFALVYAMSWHRLTVNPMLLKGASTYFIPWPPWPLEQGRVLLDKLLAVFADPGGFALPALAAGVLVFGAARSWRESAVARVMILSFVLAAAASALGKYPFMGRFLLFLTPALFFLITAGLADLGQGAWWRRVVAVGLGLILIVPMASAAMGKVSTGREREDARTLMRQLRARYQPGDAIFVNDFGQWAFSYYYLRDFIVSPGQSLAVFADGLPPREEGGEAVQYFCLVPRQAARVANPVEIKKTPISRESIFVTPQRSWLLFLHNRASEAALRVHLAEFGRCLYSSEARGGSLFLYEMNGGTAARSTDQGRLE